jgi:DNA-binding transcriptional LysR family regulator
MNLWRLECFLALAEELHFGKAARRLHISQPALSQQIKQLENDLGVSLVNRSAHLSLTPAGRVLREQGHALLIAADEIVESARLAGRSLSGELRIHYGRNLPVDLGRGILRLFQDRHPEVIVSKQIMWAARNIESLKNDTADATFVTLPIGADSAIEFLTVGVERQYLAMSEDHDLAARSAIAQHDLDNSTIVPWDRDLAPQLWDMEFGDLDSWGVTFAPPESDVQHRMVIARRLDAVTPIDEWVMESLLPQGMVARPFDPPRVTEFGLAWRSGTRNALVLGLVETARDWLATTGRLSLPDRARRLQ